MNNPGRYSRRSRVILVFALVMVALLCAGAAWGSSEGEGPKGWLATDTARRVSPMAR